MRSWQAFMHDDRELARRYPRSHVANNAREPRQFHNVYTYSRAAGRLSPQRSTFNSNPFSVLSKSRPLAMTLPRY